MNLPKVKFEFFDIDENIDNLVWYLNQKNSQNSPLDFYNLSIKLFPELKDKIYKNMNNQEIYMVINEDIRPILENLSNNLNITQEYQQIWNEVNDDIMKDLENKLQIHWPRNEEIICNIGLLPVSPRDIESHTFCVNYGINKDDLIAIAIHELCHFLYFEKWKEIYPNYDKKEFSPPHIAWYLSEAMIDPLINNAKFKKYTNSDLSAYPIFYKTYIDGKSLIDILREYAKKYPIDIAIKKGYELFKKYEKIIIESM